jgi:hypothetical protein
MPTSVTRASPGRAISGMTVNQPGHGRQQTGAQIRLIGVRSSRESIIGRADQNSGYGAPFLLAGTARCRFGDRCR